MLSKKDLLILSHLRQDARMSLTDMSKKTNIPVSTIFDRLKETEKNCIIRHTALLDFSKLGFSTRAHINLKVARDDKEQLKDFLIKHQSVNTVYKINNGFDFMIEGIFRQIKDMEEFIDVLDNRFRIEDKKYFFIIEDLKKEVFLSNPDLNFLLKV